MTDPVLSGVSAAAAACRDLEQLAAATRACHACPSLVASRTTVVPGRFPARPRFLLVGEAPGAEEDLAGEPFVGRAGRLLDELLTAAGVARDEVAVANVCNCRPPGNRTPTAVEARRCAAWLDRQVALAAPPLVVTLGRCALTWALGPRARLADTRGRLIDWRGRRLIATYHPSAALRFGPAGAPRAALRDDLALAAAVTR